MDFMPTFLSLLGVEGYRNMDGFNMWDLVTGNKNKTMTAWLPVLRISAQCTTISGIISRKSGATTLGLGPALFDLEKDPRETKNVVQEHPQVVAEMKKILEGAFKVSLG